MELKHTNSNNEVILASKLNPLDLYSFENGENGVKK